MSLTHHERHELYRIESRLLRSDPKLGAMLAMFARLSAAERMPAREQITAAQDRVRQAVAPVVTATVVIAAASPSCSAPSSPCSPPLSSCAVARGRGSTAGSRSAPGAGSGGWPDPASLG